MVWMLLMLGCGGSPAVEAPSHATGFPHLVDAVVRDDAAAIEQWSHDLVPADAQDSDAALTIGASKGMLGMATDAEERRMALLGLVRGCRQCHTAESVPVGALQSTGDAELDRALQRAVFVEPGNLETLLRARQSD